MIWRFVLTSTICNPIRLLPIHREEENGGMNPGGGGSKNTAAPEQHAGLESADVVPGVAWNGLVDPEGLPFTFNRYLFLPSFPLYFYLSLPVHVQQVFISYFCQVSSYIFIFPYVTMYFLFFSYILFFIYVT